MPFSCHLFLAMPRYSTPACLCLYIYAHQSIPPYIVSGLWWIVFWKKYGLCICLCQGIFGPQSRNSGQAFRWETDKWKNAFFTLRFFLRIFMTKSKRFFCFFGFFFYFWFQNQGKNICFQYTYGTTDRLRTDICCENTRISLSVFTWCPLSIASIFPFIWFLSVSLSGAWNLNEWNDIRQSRLNRDKRATRSRSHERQKTKKYISMKQTKTNKLLLCVAFELGPTWVWFSTRNQAY